MAAVLVQTELFLVRGQSQLGSCWESQLNLGLFGLSNLVIPGSFPMQSSRICTQQPSKPT